MKSYFALLLLFLSPGMSWSQDLYVSQQVNFSFYSKAPIEDISATSEQGVSALNLQNKTIYFKVSIRSFEFRKRLMQQHFNENYMESDKYPYAEFKGNILESIDPTKDGVFPVTVQGKLNIHNVIRDYTVKWKLQRAK